MKTRRTTSLRGYKVMRKKSGEIYVCKDDTECKPKVVTAIGNGIRNTGYLVGENMNTNSIIENSIVIGSGLKDIKSVMKCGNIYLQTTKVFNKFEKFMWKKFFGVEIVPYNKEDVN